MNLIDFKQPSTWRGLLGLSGLIGWSLSPELRDHIATTIVAVLFLIEVIRNEYAAKDLTAQGSQETTGPNRDQPVSAQHVHSLRRNARLPSADQAPRPNSPFNDR